MHDVQRLISTGLRDIDNWIIDGSKVNLVSVIFNSIKTINSFEISNKFSTSFRKLRNKITIWYNYGLKHRC